MTTELKPGTCVSFKKLSDKKWSHLNGKPGLVKKQLENGLYRVMVNSKNDFQVKYENLDAVKQCPNKPQESESSAFLMWPDTPRSEYPSLQWIESQELNRICSEYLVSMGANVTKGLTQDKKKRTEDCDKLSECLKKLLGWKNPAQLRLDTVERNSDEAIACEMYVIYDMDSTAKKNKYIEHFFKTTGTITRTVDLTNSQKSLAPELLKRYFEVPLPVIKGPILHFFRYMGKTSNRNCTGKILPFTNSANDLKLAAGLNDATTLNTFSLRFKTSLREKLLKIGDSDMEKRNDASASEIVEITDACAGSCVHCDQFLVIQDMIKQLKMMESIIENESDSSTESLD